MTIFNEICYKNEQKRIRTAEGAREWRKALTQRKEQRRRESEKRNTETESGELRELRRDREKKKELSRDRRLDSRCWDFNVENVSNCPWKKNLIKRELRLDPKPLFWHGIFMQLCVGTVYLTDYCLLLTFMYRVFYSRL